MILLVGIPTEPPLARIAEQLDDLSVPYRIVNQRTLSTTSLAVAVGATGQWGEIRVGADAFPLDAIDSVYLRPMDYRYVPEYEAAPQNGEVRRHYAVFHELLVAWCEVTPARVVNRASAMASNGSKPFQAQIVREHGFAIPETLITNDPDLVTAFANDRRVIYKSVSGVRSVVRTLEDADLERLHHIRWCPTQFQEHVAGVDLRVHTVGERSFATLVDSGATDYRYASRDGGPGAELSAYDISDDLAARCVALSGAMGLEFAGIDLRVTPEGDVYCFEVNPSPAYSYYESHTGQPIARAVARRLARID